MSLKQTRGSQILAWGTVGVVYLLMVWGNTVSATGSGLACPDWPLCHGTFFPPAQVDIILEWGHRLLAFLGAMLILATVFRVLLTTTGALARLKKGILFFLVSQVLLGGMTVLLGLSPLTSTIHLLIACLLFGGLLLIACLTSYHPLVIQPPSDKLRRLSVAGAGTLLFQFLLGGLLRHHHLGLACPSFPQCTDSWGPIPWTFGTVLAFTHRWLGIALLGLFVHLWRVARKTDSPLKKITGVCLFLGGLQVLLGVLTVLGGLHPHLRATHAAVGYAMWGLLVYLSLRTGGVLSHLQFPTGSSVFHASNTTSSSRTV